MYTTDINYDPQQTNMQNLVRMKMRAFADEQTRMQRDYAGQSQQRELENLNAQRSLNQARRQSGGRGVGGFSFRDGGMGFANGGPVGFVHGMGAKDKMMHKGMAYADGGDVTDVQAKPAVPVRVSNGEFEFTPEQVANIGAAVLSAVNGAGAMVPPQPSAKGFAPAR